MTVRKRLRKVVAVGWWGVLEEEDEKVEKKEVVEEVQEKVGVEEGEEEREDEEFRGKKGVNKVNMMFEGKCLGYLAKEA